MALTRIPSHQIKDEDITAQDLAENSVGTSELQDGAVTRSKLNSNIVALNPSTGKIKGLTPEYLENLDGSFLTGILATEIADNSVSTSKLQNGAVTNVKIQDLTITNDKISTTANIDVTKINPNPLNRSNHIGTQLASTISDFNSAVASTALLKTNNLSDLVNKDIARTNITAAKSGENTDITKISGLTAGTSASPAITFSGDTDTGIFRPTDNVLSFSTNATEHLRINALGNVGIGTTNPIEKLDVVGNIQNILSTDALPIRLGAVTLTNDGSGSSVAVSGRYAYIATHANPARVVVVDISNPSSPTRVGVVILNTDEILALSIAVSGRYAYVTTDTSPAKIVVIDISNPTSPIRVGAVTLDTYEILCYSITVSGRYAYVITRTSPAKVIVIDISNPVLPTRVGAVTLDTDYANSIAISGKYAYVTTYTSPARVVVIDISNPVSPTQIATLTLYATEQYGVSITISGRYAYVATNTSPAKIVVIDISNPVSPTQITTLTLHSGETYGAPIIISGRYVYVAANTSPTKLVVIDISNPIFPIRVGAVTLNTDEVGARSTAVSGRYACIVTATSPAKVVVVDICGIETSSMIAHSLEAGNLQIRKDLTVYDNLSVRGGVNIGSGGLLSGGPIAVIGESSFNNYITTYKVSSQPSTTGWGALETSRQWFNSTTKQWYGWDGEKIVILA